MVCVLCFSLIACDPRFFTYEYSDLSGSVSKVELIEYNNPDIKMTSTLFSNRGIKRFDEKKMEIVEELDAERLDDFLQDLAGIGLNNLWNQPDSHAGMCIRLIYPDGEYEVISYPDPTIPGLLVRYNKKGKLVKYIGSVSNREDFVDIVDKYFNKECEIITVE